MSYELKSLESPPKILYVEKAVNRRVVNGYQRPLSSLGTTSLSGRCREGRIVDIFDALTAADRPYRRAISPEKSGKILKAEAKAGRIDKDIVNLFLDKKLYKI